MSVWAWAWAWASFCSRGLIALQHILAEVHLKEVLTHLHNISWRFLILASLCVSGSYFAIIGYDVLDLRQLGRSLPYATTAWG